MQATNNKHERIKSKTWVYEAFINFTHLFICTFKFYWSELFFVVIRERTAIKTKTATMRKPLMTCVFILPTTLFV